MVNNVGVKMLERYDVKWLSKWIVPSLPKCVAEVDKWKSESKRVELEEVKEVVEMDCGGGGAGDAY